MRSRSQLITGALLGICSTALAAQAQQAAPTVQPQSPAKTQTTTTQSTSTVNATPDETGAPVVQKTTDTTQTTTTQPADSSSPDQSAASKTVSTTTVAPNGAPATTTTTTTTKPATDQTGAAVTAATAADVKVGVPVFDSKGGVVGKIESVSAKGAVVSTGKAKAAIPISSFGKNSKGLVMSMTKAELESATAKPKKAATKKK